MSSSDPSQEEDDALTLVDRFLSASSGPDAQAALETLVEGLEQNRIAASDILIVKASSSSNNKIVSTSSLSADSILFLESLVQVLTTSHLGSLHNNDATIFLEQGPTLVARCYTSMMKNKSTSSELLKLLLQEPKERLVESLLAVAADGDASESSRNNNNESSATSSVSDYTRVLCLELVYFLSQHSATRRQMTTLLVGTGTTLLAQLLGGGNQNGSTSLVVQQEALRLALLLSTWPAVAKNWIFMGVADQVLQQMVQTSPEESHLTDGPAALRDWLQLLLNLLHHSDASLVPLLVLESPVILYKLTELLDLRMGRRFRFPDSATFAGSSQRASATNATINKSSDTEDDLDDLLQAGSKVTAKTTSLSTALSTTTNTSATIPAAVFTTPSLTDNEELLVADVLKVLAAMLEHESVRQALVSSNKSSSKYDALITFLWELGLLIRPDVTLLPSDAPSPFACAVPSLSLQQQALQVLAQYCCTPPDDAVAAANNASHTQRLDRLLYLVCTGGSTSSSSDQSLLRDQLALSQSALHCFRNLQSPEQRAELLLYSLAPPPPPITSNDDDDNDGDNPVQEPDTSIVARLLNTVFEQIVVVMDAVNKDASVDVSDRSKVLLSGATSALMVLLTDEASRSMLLRLTQEPSLMDQMLECLAALQQNDGKNNQDDEFCAVVILRFLVHWIAGSPQVIHSLLQSPVSSLAIAKLFASKQNSTATLTTLMLGLVMNDMGRQDHGNVAEGADDESQCGGWTRASIMEMILSHGISRVTCRLEAFKSQNELLPWSLCTLEWNVWKEWYSDRVLVVRKRLIHELTGSSASTGVVEGESTNDRTVSTDMLSVPSDNKALQDLVSQQAADIDRMNQQLSELRHTVSFQERQIAEWKKRLDSNPTQLDEMMDDYLSKLTDLELQNDQLANNLNERDTEVKSVKKQLEEITVQRDEARQETDSLRDEMTALSQAYSNLETEYQYQQQASHGNRAPTGSSTSDEHDDAPRQQSEGEESQQTPSSPANPSNEVAMLRADNARLRQDAQAADEWMAMAVEKLNELGSQNASLAQQVESMAQQLESASSSMDSELRVEMEALIEGERASRREAEVSHEKKITELEEALRAELARCRELAEHVASSEDLSQQLQAERLRVESLQEQLALLQREKDDVNKPVEQSHLVEGLQNELREARQEIERLLERSAPLTVNNQSADRARPAEIERLKEEFAVTTKRDQEELYRCEARIRDLEARLDGGLGKYTMEDIQQRDRDIEELQKANNDAQEWMANAVEQHQLLSNQVNTLVQENNALSARIRVLTEQNAAISNVSTDEASDSFALELDALRAELILKENSIQQLRDGLDVSASAEKERAADMESQLAQLTQNLAEQEKAAIDVIKQWSESYATMEKDRNALQARLDSVSSTDLEKKFLELEEQRLEDEAAAVAAVKGWEESYHALEASRTELLQRLTLLEEENMKLKVQGGHGNPIESDVSSLETDLTGLEMRLASQEQEALATIAGWQESYAALERDRTDIVRQLEALSHEKERILSDLQLQSSDYEKKMDDLRSQLASQEHLESVARMSDEMDELRRLICDKESLLSTLNAERAELQEHVTSLTNRLDAAEEASVTITTLEARVKDLETELTREDSEAQAAISEWRDGYHSLELEKNGLQKQLEATKSELLETLEAQRDLQTQLYELSKSSVDGKIDISLIEDLRARLNQVEAEKRSLEAELSAASDVVAQWEESYNALEAEKVEVESRLSAALATQQDMAAQSSADAAEEASVTITSLKARVKDLEEELAREDSDAQAAITEWQNGYNSLEVEKNDLQTQLEAAKDELIQATDACHDLQSRLDELAKASASAAESNASNLALEEVRVRVDQLEEEKRSLEAELSAASDVVAQWEESYNALEAEKVEVESRLSAALATQQDMAAQSSADAAEEASVTITSLKARVKDLEEELAREDSDAQAAITEWQNGYNSLEVEKNDLQTQLEAAKDELIQATDACHDLQSRLDELAKASASAAESNASNLALEEVRVRVDQLEEEKRSLEAELSAASDVVAQWEESYNALEAEKVEVESRLSAALATQQDMAAQSSADAAEEASVTITSLKARVKDLEEELAREDSDAQAAITEWQNGYNSLEVEKNDLQDRFESICKEKAELTAVLAGLEKQIAETRSELSLAMVKNDQLSLAKSESDSRLKIVEAESDDLKVKYSENSRLVVELEADRDAIQIRLNQMAEEVQSTFDGDGTNAEIDDLRRLVSQLQEEKDALESELASASDVVSQWETSLNALGAEKVALESRVEELLSSIESAERVESQAQEAISEWEQRCSELENERSELMSRLDVAERNYLEADASLLELQTRCENLHSELQDKTTQCQQLSSQLESMESLDEEAECIRTRLSETESMLLDATDRAKKHSDAHQRILEEWCEKTSALENITARLRDAETSEETLRAEIVNLNSLLDEKEKYSVELDSRVRALENDHRVVYKELQEKRRSFEDLSARLQGAESALTAMRVENKRLQEFERRIMTENEDKSEINEELHQLRKGLALSNATVEKLEQEKLSLRSELEAYKTEAESTIEQWKASLDETQIALEKAESSLQDAQNELVTTAGNADLAIDEWESRCRELESRICHLTSELEALQCSSSTEANSANAATSRADLEVAVDQIKSENIALLAEQKRLVDLLHERESDLKEAMMAVEFQITNNVSEKADALASAALRKHVDELRSSLQVTQQDYLDAMDARRAAEEEAELLRDDLAAILGMKNTPETQAEIRRQALHMKEEFRRKERSELLDLKDALASALDRLEASHDEQMAAEDRISKTSLQVAVYEQELVTAKSDLNLLTEKLDEMRQAETSQREAMEYRIGELQTEYQVVQKQYASKIGVLQNELSQITMERDRLMKALKDSERSKDSFFHTTVGRESSGSTSDLQAELHKLRLEKAHLLNSVSDEAAAVERRVREARAVAKSTVEAEVIVERELRLSAEKALKELQSEMSSQRDSPTGDVDGAQGESSQEHLEALRHEIQALHEQNMSLAQDITRLEEDLYESQELAREEKRKLTEELRNAMTRNVQLEREGRQEAEFFSEMARLRHHRDNGSRQPGDNPAVDMEDKKQSESASPEVQRYYDETRKLTDRLAHDRAVYLKLVDQHDELLALLAKENMFRRTVQNALERVGGKEAIKQAMLEASERAMAELGVTVDYDDEKRSD